MIRTKATTLPKRFVGPREFRSYARIILHNTMRLRKSPRYRSLKCGFNVQIGTGIETIFFNGRQIAANIFIERVAQTLIDGVVIGCTLILHIGAKL